MLYVHYDLISVHACKICDYQNFEEFDKYFIKYKILKKWFRHNQMYCIS